MDFRRVCGTTLRGRASPAALASTRPATADSRAGTLADEAEGLELHDDAVGRQVRRELRRIDPQLRIVGRLVRIADAREALDDPRASLRVQPLPVARLANLDRRRD